MADENIKKDADNGMADTYTSALGTGEDSPYIANSEAVDGEPENDIARRTKDTKRNNKFEVRLAVIILVIVALILIVSRLGSAYDIRLTRGEGGVRLSISSKNSTDDTGWSDTAPEVPYDAGGMYPFVYPWGAAPAPTVGAEQVQHQWDGSKLHISADGERTPLTLTQIYEKTAVSTAIVKTVDSSGVTYVGVGAVMTQDGYIVTNAHLLFTTENLSARIGDTEYSAELIGLDNITDIAVIKVEATGLIPAEFGNSEEVATGETVAVIGNPVGDNVNIINAVVASVDNDFTYLGMRMGMMQIYAYLGMNASGSMVLNEYGQVVGLIDTLFYWSYPEAAGMSFAVPVSEIKPIVDELLQYGHIKGRPDSGITTSDIPAAAAAYYGYPPGVYVADVNEQSTAYKAGVRRGDLIVEANGLAIQTTNELYALINSMNVGDDLTLYLYRSKDTGYVTFKLLEAN